MTIFSSLPYGFANMVLYWFGSDNVIAWIGETKPPWFWLVRVSVRLWLQVGFYMILFLAALHEIDRSLYEATWVDGGSPGWKTFCTITFPLLRNTSMAVLLLNFIATFQAFDEFWNILGGVGSGGNLSLARPPPVFLYQVAIGEQDYGQGSAGAFIVTAQGINLPALFAGAAVGAAPLVIVFLLLQRYIVQGVRMSGIKG